MRLRFAAMKRLVLLALLAACGGDDSSAQSDAGIDGAVGGTDAAIDTPSGGMFALTSPMLTEGATIATANTCDGANTSPQLVWSGNAMNAMSFAVVLTDKTNGLVHWVIYDVPGSATGLPADVSKAYTPSNVPGAHQAASYQTTVRGYLGPCPPASGGAHTYEFAAYGLDVAALPGATMATTRAEAVTLIGQHTTAKATLTGMYMR
jgi:Raf kinase inhibitor-like YbhB/YbcL family protein